MNLSRAKSTILETEYFWTVISQPKRKLKKTCATLSCVQLQYLVAMYTYLLQHLSQRLSTQNNIPPGISYNVAKYIIEELGEHACRIYYDNPVANFNLSSFNHWVQKNIQETKDIILYQAIDNCQDRVYFYMHG